MAGPVRDAVGLEAAEAMKDDPKEIAEHLIDEHGLDGAITAAISASTTERAIEERSF